jgi:hypothetical protein
MVVNMRVGVAYGSEEEVLVKGASAGVIVQLNCPQDTSIMKTYGQRKK